MVLCRISQKKKKIIKQGVGKKEGDEQGVNTKLLLVVREIEDDMWLKNEMRLMNEESEIAIY